MKREKPMKYVKMLGLVVAAAAALMAFVGASTASATVLCKTQGTGSPTGTTCPEGWAYPAGTTIHAVSEEKPVLTTSFKTIECGSSTFSVITDNEGSATETVKAHADNLTFAECNCEVKVIKEGTVEIHWIEGTHNGTLTANGDEVTASCSTIFGNVHCIYVVENTDLGTLTGGAEATADITATIPRLSTSGLCAETAVWHVKYRVTSPTPLFVTGHT